MKLTVMTTAVAVLFLAGFLTGCQDPYDYKIPAMETWESNEEFMELLRNLPREEATLVVAFTMRAELAHSTKTKGAESPVGTTVREAIEKARAFRATRDGPFYEIPDKFFEK